ncbi:transposase is4 [Holotrichia oblita]|uniref:Transposase is4 n=1 Tax=Holotrichia oblita TaxID=644536 RepID=A0ACB9TSB6_HOLOL|nr:transposase is4 [Holotrichia oblita]
MAGESIWSFDELRAAEENQIAEIPSDVESLADDYLSGDEDDINKVDLSLQNRMASDVLPQAVELDSDDEPLTRLAQREATSVHTFSPVVWSKHNFYEEPHPFATPNEVNMDESIERPVDVFLCLFPNDLLDSIVYNTNLYATQKKTQIKELECFSQLLVKKSSCFSGRIC